MKLRFASLPFAALLLASLAAVTVGAQQAAVYDSPEDLRRARDEARDQAQEARQRAERLEAEAGQAIEGAAKK